MRGWISSAALFVLLVTVPVWAQRGGGGHGGMGGGHMGGGGHAGGGFAGGAHAGGGYAYHGGGGNAGYHGGNWGGSYRGGTGWHGNGWNGRGWYGRGWYGRGWYGNGWGWGIRTGASAGAGIPDGIRASTAMQVGIALIAILPTCPPIRQRRLTRLPIPRWFT